MDYLSNHPQVDENRVGALGICAGGGYTVNAAQTELRIKAVATVSAFDVGSARREGVPRGLDHLRTARPATGRDRRTTHPGSAGRAVAAHQLRARLSRRDHRRQPELYREGYDYYCTPRAQHPNAPDKYVFTSLGPQMAFFPFEQVETISPRPLLMIAGSQADTMYFSQEAVEKAKQPKELFITPAATHIDLYDKPEFVPQVVAKLNDFYSKNL